MSIRKVGSLIFFCLYIFLVFNKISLCNNKDPNFQLTHPLKTGKMAFESALKFLGNKNIIRLDSTNYTAVTTLIVDTNIPFIRDIINTRPAWKIFIQNAAIMVGADSLNMTSGTIVDFTFEVFLDSLDGHCFLIRTVNHSKAVYERCELDTTLPFQFMDIEYQGFPNHYPNIEFSDLLSKRKVLAADAHEIIGIYIDGINKDRNYKDENEYPFWILTINGLPRFESGTGLGYSNLRMVYNDQTGRGISRSFLGKPSLTDSSFNPIPK